MIVIVIPAKGGSNRLPNKNMAPINGRPMIDYAIDDALASRRAAAVYVSTDSDAIAAFAASRNIPVLRRPETLGGEVPIIDVYRHALAVDDTGDRLAMGSTTGGLWVSEDQGDHWLPLPARLPPVYAVRFA